MEVQLNDLLVMIGDREVQLAQLRTQVEQLKAALAQVTAENNRLKTPAPGQSQAA